MREIKKEIVLQLALTSRRQPILALDQIALMWKVPTLSRAGSLPQEVRA
ncbi:hypothetical protein ACLEJQ_00190 [Pseudomonas sp. SMV71]